MSYLRLAHAFELKNQKRKTGLPASGDFSGVSHLADFYFDVFRRRVFPDGNFFFFNQLHDFLVFKDGLFDGSSPLRILADEKKSENRLARQTLKPETAKPRPAADKILARNNPSGDYSFLWRALRS